ncbi:MAG: tryptophan--tRNA ligase [Elusimicrobia bacterium GWA2_56_46]|nr:MAG: tryptophan--tRNA ligase [Elusimicrobia bacterium GWA2_56_46]OGR56128.1 MAG: tryptophan--tRNA ligase [Elusimicrobia bacterium GWC2_56_31]HBW23100.1 tryptophan--tRNA ligase [Elusimicrobiota bacterium]
MSDADNKTVVSGMRPTGRLHLGNYWGALKNWVDLQDRYRCYFFVADWHALTTGHDKADSIPENTRLMVQDWLAAGLDPAKCVIFRQSDIKEHAELYLLLGMITPVSWLLRNPTFKEQLLELHKQKYKGQEDKVKAAEGASKKLLEAHAGEDGELATHSEISTYGFLGYPVLQAADILLYRADYVPIGKDQLPHLELTREIARRFNHVCGSPLFREPGALLTDAPSVPGIDGRKMSKSYGNSIELAEEPKSLDAKIKKMYTDPAKLKVDDKGHPEGCVVFAFHKLYNPAWAKREEECKAGAIGCGACKKQLFELMNKAVEEFRVRRKVYESDPGGVDRILEAGSARARVMAAAVIKEVNKTVGMK